MPYRLYDAALFNGKYYLYWGPAPALLTAAACLATHNSHPTFGDDYLVFFFKVGIVAMAAILVLQIRRRFFPESNLLSAAIPLFSLALGVPMLAALESELVCMAEITGGQFFLLAGLASALCGFSSSRRWLWMLTTGICWTFAA